MELKRRRNLGVPTDEQIRNTGKGESIGKKATPDSNKKW